MSDWLLWLLVTIFFDLGVATVEAVREQDRPPTAQCLAYIRADNSLLTEEQIADLKRACEQSK